MASLLAVKKLKKELGRNIARSKRPRGELELVGAGASAPSDSKAVDVVMKFAGLL